MLNRFRKISLLIAYAVATIPFWHYISEAPILLLMTVVVIFAYLMVVLSSVDAAQTILSSEKAKVPLPRWLPQKTKYEKWWLIVCHTLKWHLLLVPVKMGLALGFVEFLHIVYLVVPMNDPIGWRETPYIISPYLYISYRDNPIPAYPQWETVLLGIVALTLFSCLECLLIASLSLLTRKASRLIILRILLASFSIAAMSQYEVYYYRWPDGSDYCAYYDCSTRAFMDVGELRMLRRLNVRIGETIHTASLTLDDMGILLAANMMRPVGENSYFTALAGNYIDGVQITAWDNRSFVLRQCVAGILGIFLYLGTTWGILWLVENEPALKQSKTVQSS